MRTGMRSAGDVGPYIAVVQQLQNALAVRAECLLEWRETPQGLIADIPEGKLLLTTAAEFWKLTVIYEVEVPADMKGPDTAPRKVVWGHRPIMVGSVGRLQRLALDLALGGVPGGPTVTEDMTWTWVHGSQRMVLPTGELRISESVDGPCTLTFEDGVGVELLGKGTRDELLRQAPVRWEKRLARPLQLVVQGRTVKLRSIDIANVLGYHAVTDNRLIALVRAGDDLALVYIDGLYPYLIARVSWDEALTGEAFNVDALMEIRSPANHAPSANEAPERMPIREPSATASHVDEVAQDVAHMMAGAGPRATSPPGYTPMPEFNRELCRWYLERLHGRLKGRGARKARALVLLMLEAIEWCQVDITGTRAEVHAELMRILRAPTLPGGDRNIRDCLDLLVSQSQFARREADGTRCTLVLSQFQDLDSTLMRRIAMEKAADEAEDAQKATTAGPTPSETTAEPTTSSEPTAELIATSATGAEAAVPPAETIVEDPTVSEALANATRTPSAHANLRLADEPSTAPMNSPADQIRSERPVADLEPTSAKEATPAFESSAVSGEPSSYPSAGGRTHVSGTEEPPASPAVWQALATLERARSRTEGLTPAPGLPRIDRFDDPAQLTRIGAVPPSTSDLPRQQQPSQDRPLPDVSFRPLIRRPPSTRSDPFEPKIEIRGSPRNRKWDRDD